MPLVGDGRLSHMARETSYFIFFFGAVLFELTFSRWKKFRTSHVLSSRIFILEKGRRGAAIRND